MSENELSMSSATTEDEESSGEDMIEQSSVVQPYSNEPLADSDEPSDDGEATDDEDGIPSATIAQRFERVIPVDSWCQCGRCSDELLANAREFRCCKEIGYCLGKLTFEGKEPQCIIQHWEFEPITHEAVLKNVGTLLYDKSGKRYLKQKHQTNNEYYRAVAYRWITRWLCGIMGWDNARPLPACIYTYIRKKHPSSSTKGFKTATQRE